MMTPLDGGLALIGVLAALFVPWLLVATLPGPQLGAHRRGDRTAQREQGLQE